MFDKQAFVICNKIRSDAFVPLSNRQLIHVYMVKYKG